MEAIAFLISVVVCIYAIICFALKLPDIVTYGGGIAIMFIGILWLPLTELAKGKKLENRKKEWHKQETTLRESIREKTQKAGVDIKNEVVNLQHAAVGIIISNHNIGLSERLLRMELRNRPDAPVHSEGIIKGSLGDNVAQISNLARDIQHEKDVNAWKVGVKNQEQLRMLWARELSKAKREYRDNLSLITEKLETISDSDTIKIELNQWLTFIETSPADLMS